jgi:formylglycine-generating enzyme required for sulfatase activity
VWYVPFGSSGFRRSYFDIHFSSACLTGQNNCTIMLRMFRKPFTFLCFVFLLSCSLFAAPPIINYAGNIKVRGVPFNGDGFLKFAFVNPAGNVTYWSNDGTSANGSEPSGSVSVKIRGGLYSILLGNTAIEGMGAIDPSIFQQYSDVHIRVWFNDGERGFQQLLPDHPFASVPYALSAGNAEIAPGSVSLNMLSTDVQTSLGATIDRSRLSEDVKADLNRTIGEEQLSAEVTEKLNRTITLGDLDPQVVADLNDSVADGSITTNQLNEQILKYLRPEITQSPVLAKDREQVYSGQTITLSSDAEGKFLSYQWLKDGEPVPGATNREFTITDANGSLHNGNYTVQVSNDFGSVSSEVVQIDINDTRLIHQIDLNSTVSLEMIWVEPGTFSMGQDGVATPVHEVTLTNGFYLGKYEVTQAQYEAVMTGNTDSLSAKPSEWPNNPERPVEKVSWDDIQVFLTRLNAQEAGNIPEGWAYVLPTEAQWEYACRAGTTTVYSWGDTITSEDANYNNTIAQTTDVGQYSANPWGFFDMHGNVWEWTSDWHAPYSSVALTDPEGPATGSFRVNRGGSWNSVGTRLRSANRHSLTPSAQAISSGFRVGFQQIPADVASPEMQIFGGANITHFKDTAWVDPGVEAHDVRDGNLTSSVTVSGTVDVNTTGTYTLTYTVSDAAGNEASITRTVNVGIPANYTTDLNSTVSLEMIWVEPGTFTMGQNGVATPVHEVTLSNGFYLGKYEVTQAQYEAVMTGNSDNLSATPSQYSGNPNRPVEKVSWDDVQVFLTRLNAQEAGNIPEGWAYVLPTEAQWEYACRAGTTTAYSWGDTITSDDANYNWDGDHNTGSDFRQTRDVGQYAPNPWGFFDMHGNVWEWTSNWYAAYSSGSVTDPEGPATGSDRVRRGGSWYTSGTHLRSARRTGSSPGYRNYSMGFRVGFQRIPADVTSPEMQIFGDANITHLKDTAWVDPGVEAHDVRDGNITDSITVSGTVDVNTTGTYTLTYTVSDGAGNEASITRTVHVGIPANYAADLNPTVSLEMIWVEPGSFTMGSPTTETSRQTNETQHEVTLTKGFYLGKYEVTQAQYEAVMTGNTETDSNGNVISATPSQWPNNPDRPVEKVSWDDIQVFLTRLNAQEADNIPAGWAYVLPTEAQWEYACRAGTTTAYSWGDTITIENANYSDSGYSQTRDVGLYDANPWGFFDMHGNVWEWTADWYTTFSTVAVTDPEGPASGSNRVNRGGSWGNAGVGLRSARRINSGPIYRGSDVGFRVSLMEQ